MRTQIQKEAIFRELERESSLKGISIELSREAGKFTQEVEVPKEYKRHEHIFDPVESKKLPPSRSWDHAITLKPDTPDTTASCTHYHPKTMKPCVSGLRKKKAKAT